MKGYIAILAVALIAGAAIAALWHYIMLATAAWLTWHIIEARLLKRRPRPRASWAKNLQAIGVAYAAWNSRWLKPTTKATSRAIPAEKKAYDEHGEVPF